jgi:hypothetical protein
MPLFARDRTSAPRVIGVIHVRPLPGSAGWDGDLDRIGDEAIEEAGIYLEAGIDALIVENMHDVPYLRGRVDPETTAAMAVVARAVKETVRPPPVGVQLLAGANREALGVAIAAGLDFLRVEGFAYAHVADEGLIDACAGELVRARAALRAESIEILADIKKKHSSHAITADLSIEEIAHGTEFCRADGLIVTGPATGRAPMPDVVARVRGATHVPVLVGSGVTPENASSFAAADGLIVGSAFKRDGRWDSPVDGSRIRALLCALGR